MIRVRTSLFATDTTIDRPLLITVVEDLKRYLGIDKYVYYTLDEVDKVGKQKNKLGEISSDNAPRSEFITIEKEIGMEEGYGPSLVNDNTNYFPIYKDPDIHSKIAPIITRTNYVLNFTYYSRSKNRADAMINRLRLKPSLSDWTLLHDIQYSYTIPGFIMDLLIEINSLKNTRLTTPLVFSDYIRNTFDSRATMVNSGDGDTFKTDLAIQEVQLNARGFITSDLSTLKTTYDEEHNSWKVELEYRLAFERPVSLVSEYPILIYNNLIKAMFRINNADILSGCKPMTFGDQSLHDLVKFNNVDRYLQPPSNSYHLNIPKEDNFKAEIPDPYMVRILSIVTVVDPTNPTDLFNVNDIQNIKFKDGVIDFMKNEYQYMSKPYESLFYFELLKDGIKDYNNEILIDADLNLTTKYPMDIKSIYRVMINATSKLDIIKPIHLKRMSDFILSIQANLPSNEIVPLVDYMLDLFSIPGTPRVTHNLVPSVNSCDLKYLLVIKENAWRTMYTVQRTTVYASLLETKK